jgi:superoxide dismutase, Fe-Mn family
MKFELPPLPYEFDALEPYISRRTLEFHYEKHHRDYLQNLKEEIDGTPKADKTLEQLIGASQGSIFNNAAQVWNHTFYWNSLKPQGGAEPPADLADGIKRDFGSYAEFRKLFTEAATTQFGSGWAWLVLASGKLSIVTTPDAYNPLTEDQKPLFAVDVWEHAYYLDYQNERRKYVESCLDHLVNWEFATKNLRRPV